MKEEVEFARIVARRIAGFELPPNAVMAKSGNMERPLNAVQGKDIQELRVYMHVNQAGSLGLPNVSLEERIREPTAYALNRLDYMGINAKETKKIKTEEGSKDEVLWWYHTLTPGRDPKVFKAFVEELRRKMNW